MSAEVRDFRIEATKLTALGYRVDKLTKVLKAMETGGPEVVVGEDLAEDLDDAACSIFMLVMLGQAISRAGLMIRQINGTLVLVRDPEAPRA